MIKNLFVFSHLPIMIAGMASNPFVDYHEYSANEVRGKDIYGVEFTGLVYSTRIQDKVRGQNFRSFKFIGDFSEIDENEILCLRQYLDTRVRRS